MGTNLIRERWRIPLSALASLRGVCSNPDCVLPAHRVGCHWNPRRGDFA